MLRSALEKLIDRLERGKYGDRILGYHIAYGASGECVFWGRMSERYGDYGICVRRASRGIDVGRGTPECTR